METQVANYGTFPIGRFIGLVAKFCYLYYILNLFTTRKYYYSCAYLADVAFMCMK